MAHYTGELNLFGSGNPADDESNPDYIPADPRVVQSDNSGEPELEELPQDPDWTPEGYQ